MGAKVTKAAPERAPAESRWSAFKRWSGIEDPEVDARLDAATGDVTPGRGPSWLPLALLLILYGLAVLVYVILGSRQPLPQVAPDEYQYSALARSIADGNGLTYNGGSVGIRAALYLYAIAPAWIVTDSLTQSYAIAKAMSAAMICTVVFPTWLLARRYMPPLVALIPAVLMVAGSWMSSAGQLLMENLALPLATASLAALVMALTRPGGRWFWIALAFAGLATASRAQLAVLLPIIMLALVVDLALQGRAWRARLREGRWTYGVIGLICLVGGTVVIADPATLGAYEGLRSQSDLERGLPLVGRQGLAFIAMSAVLPFIVIVALSLRRRAWDEGQLRAPLVVFWVATVTLVVVTGILTTAFGPVDWSIQRYVEYSLPLLYVLVVAGIWRGLVSVRLLAGTTALVAGILLFTPAFQNIQEQRGMFGPLRRADQLLGIGPGVTMALLAVILGGGTLLAIRLVRNHSGRSVLLASLLVFTGLTFLLQNQASWDWQISQARTWREGFPRDLSWIDRATDRKLARIVAYFNPFRTPQTEVFNRRVNRTYTPAAPTGGAPVTGFTCRWSAQVSGALDFAPSCGPAPTAFYLNDDGAKITFYDQTVVAQRRDVGRVVTVAADPPKKVRLKAVVTPFCLAPMATQDQKTGEILPSRSACGGSASGKLYLDQPGTLVLRFAGGQADQQLQVVDGWTGAERIVDLPAGKPTDVTLDVPKGTQQWQVAGDWQGSPPAVPGLTSAVLKQGGTSTELLY